MFIEMVGSLCHQIGSRYQSSGARQSAGLSATYIVLRSEDFLIFSIVIITKILLLLVRGEAAVRDSIAGISSCLPRITRPVVMGGFRGDSLSPV